MSYILDALKKAEAERNTGTMPGPLLPQSTVAAVPVPSVARRSPWPWLALPVMLAVVSAGFFWLRPSPTPTPAAPAVQAAQVAAVAQAPAQRQVAEQPQEHAETRVETVEKIPENPPVNAKAAKRVALKKAASPTTVSTAPIPSLRELPDSIQQQIPPLKIGGYIYSASKADRSVLINNRLLREGDEAAPGLYLERMLPNEMVLNYKGYQYRMNY